MDKDWIEHLKERLYLPAYEVEDEHGEIWWTMPESLLDEAFAELAQAIEEDKNAVLEEASVGWHEADDFRLAKMVLMAQALRVFQVAILDIGEPIAGPLYDAMQAAGQALSAVPKTIWSGKGYWFKDEFGDLWLTVMVGGGVADFHTEAIGSRGKGTPRGELGDILVLTRPEQKAEQ